MTYKNYDTPLQAFLTVNHIQNQQLAQFLSISKSAITQAVSGKTNLSKENINKIKENSDWDTSMLTNQPNGVPTITATATANNNSTATNNINGDHKDFIRLLEKKDEQMDRLLTIIEKLTDKGESL